MAHLSPRRKLPLIDLADNPDVVRDLNALGTALDNVVVATFGLLANRPVTGQILGDVYWATDDYSLGAGGTPWWWTGSAWASPTTSEPLGAVQDYALAGDPPGGSWMVMDGRAISRTTYAALFALSGSLVPFGPGNGTTTFNIPDARGRTTVGAGAGGGLTARTLGATLGEENHTLTVAELAQHQHGSGSYSIAGYQNNGAASGAGANSINTLNFDALGSTAGGGGGHNNIQPSLVLNKIIRVL